MKANRIAAVLLAAAVLVAGCGGGAAQVSEEEATQAFGIAFASTMMASMATAFGQEMEGMSYDEEAETVTFDKFSLSQLDDSGDADATADMPYTTISGTLSNADGNLAAVLTLEGGPVTELEFTLSAAQLQGEGGDVVDLKVNGRDMQVNMTE